MPSHAPMAPTPSPAAPQTDADTDSETDPETTPEDPRRRSIEVAWIHRERRAIYRPGVIDRNIDDRRVGGRDGDWAAVRADGLLFRTAQVTCSLCLLAHCLHGIHYVLGLVIVGVAQVGCPLEVLIHLRQHGWKRHQRLDAGIPVMGIGAGCDLVSGVDDS